MPHITTDDGVKLYYEETGSGAPVIFVHEFAGDGRSWEPQVRFFARRYRCIVYWARGYTPSDVPKDPAQYSQDRATDDLAAVMKGLGIRKAHVVGLSMGAFAALHFGLRYARMAVSLTAAGVGYGATREKRAQFHAEVEAVANRIKAEGMKKMADSYARGPTRVVFEEKDPRGWAEFHKQLAEHSTLGSALTMLGVQRSRPSLYDLEAGFRKMRVPTLIVCGDEDDPTLEPGLFLKRAIPSSALLVMPKCGHTMNLEDPDAFNRAVLDFLTMVDGGRWTLRDPSTTTGSIIIPGKKG
ncbi:MAG: alpha/beta hydrolase [Alphaproteobacteria bacterium]|nr:alpha/beta hydrolase [Alphaproteobacteria bacterium]